MNRVLLVFEDYQLLSQTESILRKVGYNVLSITSEMAFSEAILSFPANLILIQGFGKKVNPVQLSMRLKDLEKINAKVGVIISHDFKINPADIIKMRMDATLEQPVDTLKLLQACAQLTGMNLDSQLEKLNKALGTNLKDDKGDAIKVSGSNQGSGSIAIGGDLKDRDSQGVSSSNENNSGQHITGTSGQIDDSINTHVNSKTTKSKAPSLKLRNFKKADVYQEFIDNTVIDKPPTRLTKEDSRRRQNEIRDKITPEAAENQDQLRSQFTKRLFRK